MTTQDYQETQAASPTQEIMDRLKALEDWRAEVGSTLERITSSPAFDPDAAEHVKSVMGQFFNWQKPEHVEKRV